MALRRYETLTVTFYTFLLGAVFSLIAANPARIVTACMESPGCSAWCLEIGIACTVAPYLLYTKGLARLEAGKAAILACVEPVVGALIGFCLFHDSMPAAKLLGMGMILLAVILLNLKQEADSKTAG